MVVGEVENELFEAEESVSLGELAELGKLADEPADLELGLDVDLILLADLPPELLLEEGGELYG